jgi:hypothetical protein
MKRVNHSTAYRAEDGANTNQVESFFSRLERAYVASTTASRRAISTGMSPTSHGARTRAGRATEG